MTEAGKIQDGGRTLIGRGRELQELTAGILDAAGGTGGLFMVQGEPGIGKSRLVEAAADLARRNGLDVHWGRCWEAGGAPPYWPWIQVLRSVCESPEAPELAEVPGGASLGQLLPEMADILGKPEPAAELEPEQARFQLMDAVAGAFRLTARGNPMAIVIEDLHAADPASVGLLEFVARQIKGMSVVVIGTFREADAQRKGASDVLFRIQREARSTLRLGALNEADAVEFIRSAVGVEVGPRVVTAIREASEGNPLYVLEIAGLMEARGLLAPECDRVDIAIPETIKAVIEERTDGLDPDCSKLLGAASVIGREFSVRHLSQLIETEIGEVETALAGAKRARIVEDLGPDRYCFLHILIREVFHGALDPALRTALHLRRAGLIEAEYGEESRRPWAELAHHLLLAGPEVAARAADACIRAAEQAQKQFAFDDAADFFGRAVELDGRSGPADTGRRCGLMLDHAQALLRAGNVSGGREVCLDAVEHARQLEDAELLARAALIYGAVFVYAEIDSTLVNLLREALAALPEGDGAMRARVQARLASALQPSEHPEEAFQIAREAIAMARRVGDRGALLDAIRSGCSALMDLADPAERLALNREHVALAEELGQPYDAFRGHMRSVIDAIELGDFETSESEMLACDRIARQTGLPHHRWPAASFRAMAATMAGRFEEAEEWIEKARRQADRVQDPNAERSIAFQTIGLARARESFGDMVPLQRHLREQYPGLDFAGLFVWVLGNSDFVRIERRDHVSPDVVVRGAKAALSSGDPSLLCLVSEVAAAPEYWESADQLWQRLQNKSNHWVSWGLFGMVAEGPVSRILALLASGLGRAEQADRHFAHALDQARTAGALPMVSRTAYEFAGHLMRADTAGNTDRISGLLDEAHEIAVRLGQTGLVDLINLRREEGEGEPTEKPGVPVVGFFRLEREGELWVCACGGESFSLKNTKGVRMLAKLVAEPGREAHVLDLSGEAPKGEAVDGGDAGEVLDQKAKAQYQRRVEELRAEIEEAESFNDPDRASRAREELDAIATELSRAFGLSGRERRTGSAAERARVNVQRRLRDAVKRIAQHSPAAGKHLDWALKTGMYCVYDPK